MMQTTVINTAVACCAFVVSALVGIGGTEIVKDNILKAEPYGLQAADLRFEDGMFVQRLVPINTNVVPAKWTAEINRDGSQICGGGGESNYEGVEQVYSPDDWTGDNCPPLQSGDVASATWKYQDVSGNNIIISREVIIP